MEDENMVCWKCGVSIAELPMPLGRSAECPACAADLHVCRMCEFYDPKVSKSCRETIAEEVKNKERSNFCDYFRIQPGAFRPHDTDPARVARAQLEALFGGKQTDNAEASQSESEIAREALEKLFRSGDKE